jgi:vitamin B12 transporter
VRHTSYALGVPFNNDASGLDLVPSLLRRQHGTETQIAAPLTKTFTNGSVELTLSDARRNDDFSDPEDPFGQVSSSTDSDTRRARLQARYSLGAFGNLVAGAEAEDARVHDVTNFGVNLDNQTRRNRSLFVEDRFSRQVGNADLEVSAGLREDHFDSFGSQLSPRLAVALRRGIVKYHVAYGKAFRAPSLGELYFPFLGNPNLDPERSQSIEA